MPEEIPRPRPVRRLPGWLGEYAGLAAVLGLLILFFGLRAPHFLTPTTFRTIANQIPDAVVIAVGMTFVLIIGGIDLSVGSVLALSGAALGVALVQWKVPLPLAVGICLATGALCGVVNGVVIARWSLPSFIVTLGMLEIARGGAYLVTDSKTSYIGQSVEVVSNATLLGISLPSLLALLVVALGQFALGQSVWGRYLVAMGRNEEAVRMSGIDTRAIRLGVFVLCSLLAAMAAVINVSKLAAADPNAGTGFELQAIAAVVIGGTSLMGGRGSVVGSLFGVLIIAVLGNGLAQIGAQEPVKRVVTGCVIVGAVVLDYYRHRLEKRKG